MKKIRIKSVAVIGAGAAGAITAAALEAEKCFDRIRVFERRETAGGTWNYDPDPGPAIKIMPGANPPEADPPLKIPSGLPRQTSPCRQERFERTPVYDNLTTNVPDMAMCFSDARFAYGPFVPHWIPKQYVQNYFSLHRTDGMLVLNTTVEDLSKIERNRWRLTLRRKDGLRELDEWWTEEFDAVVLANGHYSVPFVPDVPGLDEYIRLFPSRISHSKSFRNAKQYQHKKVIVVGNSASGCDIARALVGHVRGPLYVSVRSPGPCDGKIPESAITYRPVIKEYLPPGDIVFADGSVLTDVNVVIYCTGYKASFPFWNTKANGGPIWDYERNRLVGSYQHTFFKDHPTLGIVGIPKVLTFRAFEYQAIALARTFAGRNARPLPPKIEQERWEQERWNVVTREHRKFHGILWDNGETIEWFRWLFVFAGLPTVEGLGRCPPVLNDETRWAIDHLKKPYELGISGKGECIGGTVYEMRDVDEEWTKVRTSEGQDSSRFW